MEEILKKIKTNNHLYDRAYNTYELMKTAKVDTLDDDRSHHVEIEVNIKHKKEKKVLHHVKFCHRTDDSIKNFNRYVDSNLDQIETYLMQLSDESASLNKELEELRKVNNQ